MASTGPMRKGDAQLAIEGLPESIKKEVQELLEGARKQLTPDTPTPNRPPTPPQ